MLGSLRGGKVRRLMGKSAQLMGARQSHHTRGLSPDPKPSCSGMSGGLPERGNTICTLTLIKIPQVLELWSRPSALASVGAPPPPPAGSPSPPSAYPSSTAVTASCPAQKLPWFLAADTVRLTWVIWDQLLLPSGLTACPTVH